MHDKGRGGRIWRVIAGVVAIVLIALIAAIAYFVIAPPMRAAAEPQPINFPHSAMVKAGINCIFCHQTAMKSPAAGMPSVYRCMGCHRIIAANTPAIQQVKGYYDRGEPIPWVRVNTLPRFVYFSHEVHVGPGGQNCENCHGDVGNMGVDRPVVVMNMGWCLSCHEKQPNADQLKDCVVCHK